MAETCTRKLLGIFHVTHHNWGPWTVTIEHEPIYYMGSKIDDEFTYKYHKIITRQCLNCTATQSIRDPDWYLTS